MKPLSPTLWRTCRVLNGRVRLDLLSGVINEPGQNVSQLADRVGIGVSDASQELRRLQSRGLLKRSCAGRSVIYLPVPDPLVPTAAPLLKTLQSILAKPQVDLGEIAKIAKGPACERRIAMLRILAQGPRTTARLAEETRINPDTLKQHLGTLQKSGWVEKQGRTFIQSRATHPLHAALLKLI